eukprot:8514974-Alexandrium_andersonii.AAC.1
MKAFLNLRRIGRQRRSQFPELSSHYKAATVKLLRRYVAELTRHHCTGTRHSMVRTVCVWSLADFSHACDVSGLVLDSSQAQRI